MRSPTPSPKSLHRAATLALGLALSLGVASAAHASDDPPPPDACGQDGGYHHGGDAGIGDYVFSEPVAAPAPGARWEPACSAAPAGARSSALASLLALSALGLVLRRHRSTV